MAMMMLPQEAIRFQRHASNTTGAAAFAFPSVINSALNTRMPRQVKILFFAAQKCHFNTGSRMRGSPRTLLPRVNSYFLRHAGQVRVTRSIIHAWSGLYDISMAPGNKSAHKHLICAYALVPCIPRAYWPPRPHSRKRRIGTAPAAA